MDGTLSVIMPVRDGEAFLSPAIDSILGQTFHDFELIVIDDASSDDTPALLQRISDPRLKVLRNPEHAGFSRSLNRGLEVAAGRYVARMDADDLSHPDRFAEQVRYLDAHAAIGLVATDCSLIDSSGTETSRGVIRRDVTGAEAEWRLLWENLIAHPSVMLRTELLRAAGGYSESFGHYAEDLDLWLRLASRSELAVLGQVLVHLRKHERNVTVVDQRDHIDEVVRVVQEHLAGRVGYEPSGRSVRLLRRLPLEPPATAGDVDDACRVLRNAYAMTLSGQTERHEEMRRVRADLARRLLRLARIRGGGTAALRILGGALSVSPEAALSTDAVKALFRGLGAPRRLGRSG